MSFGRSVGHKAAPRALTLTPNDAVGVRHLTVNGGAAQRTGLSSAIVRRWGLGYDFTGATQFLSRVGASGHFGLASNMAACAVFYADAPTAAIQQVLVTHSGSTRQFEIQFTTSTVGVLFTSGSVYSSLYQPVAGLNRVWVSRAGTAVRFRLNDNPIETATLSGTVTSATSLRLGVDATGGEPFDGAMLEVRLWTGVTPSDAVLDSICNPNDYTYQRTLQGQELAAYFMEV